MLFTGCGPTSTPTSEPTISFPSTEPSVSAPTVDPTISESTTEPTIPPVTSEDPTVPPTSEEPSVEPTIPPVTSEDPTLPPTISEDPTLPPDTSEEPVIDPWEEALKNTVYYSLINTKGTKYYEIVQYDFYYSSPMLAGYVIPDDDLNYFHQYSVINVEENKTYYEIMEVYGRTFRKNEVNDYLTFRMYDILYYCASSFNQGNDELTYISTDKNLSPIFEEFFQSKLIGACNYFVVTLTQDYRFESISFYENYSNDSEMALNLACNFVNHDKTHADFYNKWVENGKEINIRIKDVKTLVPSLFNPSIPTTLYDGEEITIDATVTSIDLNNNFYITQNNERTGPIGLEVKVGKEITDLNVGDNITITGTIETETTTDINTYMKSVSYEKLGTSVAISPAYDEDYMVDTYGGGTYAAMMFNKNLIYGGSLYSSYAYVLELPNTSDLNKDIVVTLICPNIVDLQGKLFVLDLVIPAKLDSALKGEMITTLKDAGTYSKTTIISTAKELSLEKFIVDYNFSSNLTHSSERGSYPVALIATNDSKITNKLSLVEKMDAYFGIKDFPILNWNNASYKFGGSSGLFIESVYGDYTTKEKTGLFISYSGISETSFNQYQTTLINYGFSKYDEIKDISKEKHVIFTLNDVVLDFSLSTSDYTLLCWVYTKPIIRLPSIEEQLKNAIGSWFDVDKYFARLSDTYDADYSLYKVTGYAGNDYIDNPLTVLTLDLKTNRYSEYLSELVKNLSYKQYRNPETNRPATYKIRGVNHQGIYQADKNIFIDMAVYETKDYTYTGHNKWNYRIELVFLNDTKPMDVKKDTNLDALTNIIKNEYSNAYFNPTLPSDAVVENWFVDSTPILERDYTYGFGSRNESYIYTSQVDECFNSLVSALKNAGYIAWGSTTNVFVIYDNEDNSYIVTLLKEKDRGFVRVIQGTGGVDFWRT